MTLDELIAITRAGPAVIMVAKEDMLAMLEQRARVADNISAAHDPARLHGTCGASA